MDLSIERDSTAIGSLFQLIINDLKNTSPLWDDFVAKASKLHACLRAAIQAIASYLDAFQKIADAATNSRGASKEIGTALTRVCLRHKAVETRLKTFTTAIMDCLVLPLQDKIEDWKRQVSIIDKEHAKEYKRCRSELKKRSTDTLRLQKKARKGQADSIQSLMDSHMHDVTLRRAELEEVEKKSLRAAMIEERTRYCAFVNLLQPVVKEECEVMFELGHLQEAMQSIAIVTKDPGTLPQASEELIMDAKSNMNLYPESPGGNSGSHGCSNSLGSRKSSVCSISSINSSGSSSSPGHHHYQRSISQFISPSIRLKPGESSDSGFCSSPALTLQTPSTTNQSNAVSTWPPHSPDNGCNSDRPHTISSTYEKGHQRPALTVYTFQNPETIQENAQNVTAQKSPACRPPLPVRCSSLERPLSTNNRANNSNLMTRQCPSPIPPHISKELPQQQSATQQPTYVNMSELANMAALKITNNNSNVPQPPEKPERHNLPPKQPHQLQHQQSTDSHSSMSSSHISSPEHSISKTLSMASHDSTAGTPTGGAPTTTTTPSCASTTNTDISSLTPTNNEDEFDDSKLITPQLTNTNIDNGDGSDDNNILKITETDSISITNTSTQSNTNTNTSSPTTPSVEKDQDPIVTRGSVLQKTSMFEKAAASSANIVKNVESIYGVRKDEKVSDSKDNNVDQIYEDSIQELNNLIGELDSFQREHEAKEKLRMYSNSSSSSNNGHHLNQIPVNGNNGVFGTSDAESDKISLGSLNYSTHSTKYSDSEISRYVSETSSLGFENPTFNHLNTTTSTTTPTTIPNTTTPNNHIFTPISQDTNSDSGSNIVMIYDHQYIPDPEYVKQNTEIVVLRSKENDNCQDLMIGHKPTHIHNNNITDSPKHRLSSFRTSTSSENHHHQQHDNNNSYKTANITANTPNSNITKSSQANTHYNYNCKNNSNNSSNNNSNINSNINNNCLQVKNKNEFKANLDEKLRQSFLMTNNHMSLSSSSSSATLIPSSTSLLSSTPSTPTATISKPTILPRPASLSGTRIARRSSVNSIKPPPPVRRSSSVTPSHNVSQSNSPNVIQQQQHGLMTNSTESLPPPPAYLLDQQKQQQSQQNQQQSSIKVSETVKALSALKHTPASPNAIRRMQSPQQTSSIQSLQSNNIYSSSNTIPHQPPIQSHAPNNIQQHQSQSQPQLQQNITYYCNNNVMLHKKVAATAADIPPPLPPPNPTMQQKTQSAIIHDKSNYPNSFRTVNNASPNIYGTHRQMSSFRCSSPNGPNVVAPQPIYHANPPAQPKTNPNLIAQLNARINNKQQSSQSGDDSGNLYGNSQQFYQQTESVYGRSRQQQYQQQQQQQPQNYDDYSSQTLEKTGNSKVKGKSEFLENLNAKLAKQGISNKAFAVRSLINSKALPDPRKCHESLMDQIKRGATLKRNQKINDRSAPKIH